MNDGMTMKTEDIKLVINRIGEMFGIRVLDNQHDALLRNLAAAAKDLGNSLNDEKLVNWFLLTNFDTLQMGILARHLTVGETYFYREPTALQLFSEQIIPNHLNTGKALRIWCAGCSTGEEPYTLAMIIDQKFAGKLKFSILATDINPDAIEKAKIGLYTAWSFRDTSQEIKNRYFTEKGNLFEIDKRIRYMVTFNLMNLATGHYPALSGECDPFDVIFCRNVLMYLKPDIMKEISAKFYRSLNEGGWFITSQVELNDDNFSQFNREIYQNNIFYQKITTPKASHLPHSRAIHKTDSLSEIPLPKKQKRTVNIRSASVSVDKPEIQETNNVKNLQVNESYTDLFLNTRYEECALECRRQLNDRPHDVAIYPKLILSLANMGHLTAASHFSEKWIDIDAANPEAYYISAIISMESGELEKAEKLLVKSLYLQPNFHPAQLSLGNVLNKLGKKQLAIKQYQNLLRSIENLNDPEMVSQLEGMTAGRLRQIAEIMIHS